MYSSRWLFVTCLFILTLTNQVTEGLKCVDCAGRSDEECATKPPPPIECPKLEHEFCSRIIIFVDKKIFSIRRACVSEKKPTECTEIGADGVCSYYCSTDGCNKATTQFPNSFFMGLIITCGILTKITIIRT